MSGFRTCSTTYVRTTVALAIAALAACSSGDRKTADTASPAASASTPSPDTMTAMKNPKPMDNMQGMSMTGDADRDFLRMMSDHHKGMILMAHMTKERKDAGSAVSDARKLDAAQDRELDMMQTMLEKDFKDPYAPRVLAEHQAMADALKGKRAEQYERTFYENVIKHHQEAIKMVDEYLPKGKSAAIKQMAGKMKADQSMEIAEFQKKLGQLK